MIEDTIDITIEITDICRRYNLLPDVDSQTLGERRESIENFEDSVIDDLNKVLIPSSTNITSGNTLEKFLSADRSRNRRPVFRDVVAGNRLRLLVSVVVFPGATIHALFGNSFAVASTR